MSDTPDGIAEEATARMLGLLDPTEDNPEIEAEDEEYAEDELLEDEDAEADEDPVDEEAEPVYTIKVDGEEIEVPLSELKNGYSRTSDYTRKAQELAEHRRAMQTEFEQVQQERQLYAQYLGQLAQANQPQRPNFEQIAAEQGTEAAMRARIQYEGAAERYNAIMAEQQAAQQKIAARQNQAKQEWQQNEFESLLNVRPEWKDPDVYRKEAGAIEEFAMNLGYTPDQLAEVSHRDILVLDAARKWHEAQAQARSIKPVQGKVARPGARGQAKGKSKARKSRDRFRKTGSVDDAANVLRGIMGQ